jgi:hypothetical protein
MKDLMTLTVGKIVKIKELCLRQYVTAVVISKNILFCNNEGGCFGPVHLVPLVLLGMTEENHEQFQDNQYADRD